MATPPTGWSGAPVPRDTRVNTVSSALWDIGAATLSWEPSVPVNPATVTDTVRAAVQSQVIQPGRGRGRGQGQGQRDWTN